MEQTATLSLLGEPIWRIGQETVHLPTRKLMAILAYIAVEGAQPRATLAQLFWEVVDDRARANLRRELFRLNQTPVSAFVLEENSVLSLQNAQTDLELFWHHVQRLEWAEAIALRRGVFCAGWQFAEAPEIEAWLERLREQHNSDYANALEMHAEQLATRGQFVAALQCFEQALALDDLRESALRGAMSTLHGMNETARALEYLKQFEQRLRLELGIGVSVETLALASELRLELPVAEPILEPKKNLGQLETLSKAARDLLRIAALAEQDFSLELAAAVLDSKAFDFLEAADELEQQGFLTNGMCLSENIRNRVLQQVSKPAQTLLHARILTFLESSAGLNALRLLHHAKAAHDPSKIILWAKKAAEENNTNNPTLALSCYQEAIDLSKDPTALYELHCASSRLERRLDNRAAWHKSIEAMLWQAGQSHNPAFETEALLFEAEFFLETSEYQACIERCQHLLEQHQHANRTDQARANFYIGRAFEYLQKPRQAQGFHSTALELIPETEHDFKAKIYTGLSGCANRLGDLSKAQKLNALAVESYRRGGNYSGEISARLHAGSLLAQNNERNKATMQYEQAYTRAKEIEDVRLQRHALWSLAGNAIAQYHWQIAWTHTETGISISPDDAMYEGIFREQRSTIHAFLGNLGQQLEEGKLGLACYQRLGVLSYQIERLEWLIHRYLDLGLRPEALERIEEAEQLCQSPDLEKSRPLIQLARVRHNLIQTTPKAASKTLKTLEAILEQHQNLASNVYPSTLLHAQTYLEAGQPTRAKQLLEYNERTTLRETQRITLLLQTENTLSKVQPSTLDAATQQLEQTIPPLFRLGLLDELEQATNQPNPAITQLEQQLEQTLPLEYQKRWREHRQSIPVKT